MSRIFKDWIDAYIKYTELSEAPKIFHFWTAVSTIAGAMKRRVWIWMDAFEWTPNFYIIFVAPPGIATKSTTIGIGMDILSEIDGVTFGPASCTWQALIKKLAEGTERIPKTPGDLNSELEPISCITCAVSELGTFLNFQDDKLISVLTGLWDSQRGAYEHSTLHSGNTLVQNPWVNIIAGTTPSWLKQNAPETLIGGGFASRSVFVFGSEKRHLVAYPGLIRGQEKKEEMRSALVKDLKEISGLLGEMRLSPEAIALGEEWYKSHWTERALHMASERFQGYMARKQTHVHKLAMVLSAARRSDLWITEKDLSDAINVMTAMEQDMIQVFQSIGVTPLATLLQEVMSFIWTYQQQGRAVGRQLLWRHCMQIMTIKEFEEVTNSAVQAGYMKIAQNGTDVYYKILVNPKSLTGSAQTTEQAPRQH